MRHNKRAFTLIELLVVIAIIGTLIALLAPAIGSTRERSQIAACMNNLKQITIAAFMYADDHDSKIPEVTETVHYTQSTDSVYKCPRDTQPNAGINIPSYTTWSGTPISLLPSEGLESEKVLYVETKVGVVHDLTEREAIEMEQVVFRHYGSSSIDWKDARNDQRTVVAYGDGHVSPSRKDELAELIMAIGKLNPKK